MKTSQYNKTIKANLIASTIACAMGLSSTQLLAAASDAQLWSKPSLNSEPVVTSVSVFNYARPDSTDSQHAALELNMLGGPNQNWYASSFFGEEEKRIHLGLNLTQRSQISVTGGQGVGYAQTRQAFSGANPYYFHGGSRIAFNYLGASWRLALSERQAITVGSMQIDTDYEQLEKRSAMFAGYTGDNFKANLIQVERGGDKVGQAMDLGFGWNNKAIGFQGLQTEAGGYSHQAQFSVFGARNQQFQVSLLTRNNPLAEDSHSNRILFSFSKAFGRSNDYLAASDEEKAESARKNSFNSTLVIGAAAVGAALALSSGSDSQDNAGRKNAQHDAARTTLNQINPRSIRENREYGTWIYRTPDGRYAAAAIQQGGVASVSLPTNIVPPGNTITASLHTHGGNDPRYANEVFSPTDIAGDQQFGVDGYLGTPGGKFLWHDLDNSRIVQLGNVSTR